ncbi:hypothetical protein [Microbispora sp. ATCC PTA-5024]|uniref:hypothetical protein n=1 Tax=Microbispora sp. ATCC PTA-5024 TaxID=316330 RepID=UPI0003DB8E64|nr:hypothetical protein [Microbispora sp. ATCC PTA-5024]ETK37087.1 hypothetical protein MPTA5024_05775 [Microbispora sp. ATCC PTA-5024]
MPRDARLRAAAALAALALATTLATAGCGAGAPEAASSGGTAAPPVTGSLATPTPAAQATPTPGTTGLASSSGGPYLVAGRYQPLWPFGDQAEARAWQEAYRSGGHQPWHLDADRTALAFTQGYLGFGGVDTVVHRTVAGAHARIAVGFRPEEGGGISTAAVIHLVRYGSGGDAPWEVVGTDDTTFSLTTPAYGAVVVSPMRAGGRISGVDESIRVQVRAPGSDRPLGEHCCVPAGGTDRPWTATVAFRAVPGRTLTVVAATGGHVAAVERFAVTGVRSA